MEEVHYFHGYGTSIEAPFELTSLDIAPPTRDPGIRILIASTEDSSQHFNFVHTLSHKTAGRVDHAKHAPEHDDLEPDQVGYRIDYWGGLSFTLDASGRHIWVDSPKSMACRDVEAYLTGPVLAYALRLQGHLCLHASVIDMQGGAIALAGTSGSGKSTTAAALVARGHRLVSDDVLALQFSASSALALPGKSELRLCEDALLALGLDTGPNHQHGDKHSLRIAAHRDTHPPPTLKAIYLGATTQQGVEISALGATAAMTHLLGNTYPGYYYRLQAQHRARELELVRALMDAVPVRLVAWQRSFSQLDTLCENLESDFAKLSAVSSDHASSIHQC
ncbi:MAG: hypothetical protein AAGI11_05855 [Pseudomonadota bacterium]